MTTTLLATLLAAVVATLVWLLQRSPPLLGRDAAGASDDPARLSEIRDERYLRWFVHVRWVVLLVGLALLVTTVGLGYLTPAVFSPLVIIIGLLAAANLVYAGPARRWCSAACLLALQLHVDMVGLTVALHLSGGIENPLYLFPVVNVVLGGIVLSRRQSFLLALNGGVLCALLVWAEWAHVIPHYTLKLMPHGAQGEIHVAYDTSYVGARTALQLVVLLLTAELVSRLAQHSRAHEEALAETAEAARAERELLEESLEGTETALRLVDRSLRGLWSNAQWRRWFPPGSPREEWALSWSSADDSPARRTLADGAPHRSEMALPREEPTSDTGGQVFRVTTAALHDPGGGTVRLAEMVQDITAEKRAEAAVLKAGKLATVGELAGRVAHEVNNPTAIIIGKARLLLSDRRAEMSEKVADDLGHIVDLGERVARISQALLAYGRPTIARRSSIDLRTPVRRALAFVEDQAQQKGVTVVDKLGDRAVTVVASAAELEQVFLNLVLNALDAMPNGGVLAVARADGAALAHGRPAVGVAVSDSGPGIPPDLRDRVREPFFTTKPEGRGTGLGLSVCDGLVRAHGGELRVEEGPAGGTRMVVCLPQDGEEGGR
ncbi:MAG: ATP-binding protein [Acidobacteriota bacterium]|jgi:signal transduction histidine kinase